MPHRLKPVARKLRENASDAERRLWQGVRREQIGGFKFRRQGIIGAFIVDFACFDARLVIEIDGATHATEAAIAYDRTREAALLSDGYDVLRFTNDEVVQNIEGVLETIRLRLVELRPRLQDEIFEVSATPHPGLPPQGGKGKAAAQFGGPEPQERR